MEIGQRCVVAQWLALPLAACSPSSWWVRACSSAPADAQLKTPPRSKADLQYSYSPIVKKAAPAVVNVYVSRRVREAASPFANDPVFREFFGRQFGLPTERMQNSLGSGVIVSADGVIVTNNHVIQGSGAAEIRIALSDRREFDARILLQDPKTDLAILKIQTDKPAKFAFLEFDDADGLEVGDIVLAIGNPFGVGQTVTQGIVSALARGGIGQMDGQVYIQTDAAINPGNSGGALVDMEGRLVGINTAIYSQSGGSHGIGFAIPSNLVRLFVQSAISGKQVARPWLGAKLEPVTREIAEALGLDRSAGAFVERVYRQSPALAAGLKTGDVILAVDGKEVADPRALVYRLTTMGVGGRARLDVVRDGKRFTADVALQKAPGRGLDDAAGADRRPSVRRRDGGRAVAGAGRRAGSRRRRQRCHHHRGAPGNARSPARSARRRYHRQRRRRGDDERRRTRQSPEAQPAPLGARNPPRQSALSVGRAGVGAAALGGSRPGPGVRAFPGTAPARRQLSSAGRRNGPAHEVAARQPAEAGVRVDRAAPSRHGNQLIEQA